MLFSFIFGTAHLPILTLLAGCFSFFVFSLILVEFLNIKTPWAILLGLLSFLNPLNVYELWGFMTNHFFMSFFLLSLYFLLKYQKSSRRLHLFFYVIFGFCALLVRQVILVLPLSTAVYYFLEALRTRNFKTDLLKSVFHFVLFVVFYAIYSFVIPLTPRIKEVPLQLHHLSEFDYSYSLIFGTLIVLTACLLPLVINIFEFSKIFSNFSDIKKGFKRVMLVLIFLALTYLSYIALNHFFKPESISWGEFPYFENVVERTGFYPRGVHGTKYYFAGSYDLWKYWGLVSNFIAVTTLLYILSFKLKNNIFGVFIAVYLFLMLVTETYYDRYIAVIIPITILYLISISEGIRIHTKVFLVLFLLFLGFLSYQFSADFILVNKYIWNRSLELVEKEGVDPRFIQGANAWKLVNRNYEREYLYNFSYDSSEVNEDYRNRYSLVETKEISYPLNIFVEPKIYLYKLNNE